jgi:hypothetical protein
LVIPFVVLAAIIILFFGSTTITDRDGDWWINNGNNYGDIRLHLAYITNFVSGQNIPVENPIFSGTPASYPFLINVLTAQLVTLGTPIPTALNIVSLIFLTVIGLVMYCFALRLTRNRAIASLTPFLLFTNGGLSVFLIFFPEWAAHNFSLSFLTQTTHDFTIYGGYVFGNTITTYFNPQRAFLLGFPLVMIILTELWKLTSESRWQSYLFIGLCIGLLPLVHTSSLLVVALLLPYFFIKSIKEKKNTRDFVVNWSSLVLPAAGIGFFLLHIFISQASSLTSYLRLQLNWIADQGPFPVFWIKNAGPAILFGIIALVMAKKQKELWPSFIIYSFILFFFANFIITQPWDFDNSKYLVYWYACLTVALAWLIIRTMQQKRIAVSSILIILLCLTGLFDLFRRTEVTRNWYPIVHKNEFDLVLALRAVIPPKSRVLTIGDKLDTVTPLLGRRLVFGDDPWLWSHGIRAYKQRINDVHTIYRGGDDATKLIQQYGINFIIISNNERQRQKDINEVFFSSQYEKVFTNLDDFDVYKVNS